MSQEFYTLITLVGQAKIANAVALGRSIKLSEIAVSDWDGNPTQDQKKLHNEVYRGPLNSIGGDKSNNPNWITAEAIIPQSIGGWYVREVGIYDADGDLFAVAKYPATYKPVLAGGAGKDLYIKTVLEVSNASAVELKIDPAIVLASREYADRRQVFYKTIGQAKKKSDSEIDRIVVTELDDAPFFQVSEDLAGSFPDAAKFQSDDGQWWAIYIDGLCSVKWFGAIGDGVADDTSSIQIALNVCESVYFPTGKYKVTEQLVSNKDNQTVTGINAVIDGTQMKKGSTYTENSVFLFTGSECSVEYSLRHDLPVNSVSVSIGAHEFKKGDYVLIKSSRNFNDSTNVSNKTGEVSQVSSVTNNSILLTDSTVFAYSSKTTKLIKLKFISKPVVSGITVQVRPHPSFNCGMIFKYCNQPLVEMVTVNDADETALSFSTCLRPSVKSCVIDTCTNPKGVDSDSGTGYGVSFAAGCKDATIKDSIFYRCKRAQTAGGLYPAIGGYIENSEAYNCTNGFGTHEPAFDYTFHKCTVRNIVSRGFTLRGQNTKIIGCNCKKVGAGIHVRSWYDNPYGIDGVTILSTTIDSSLSQGIFLDGTKDEGRISNVKIDNCVITNCRYNNIFGRRVTAATISDTALDGITEDHSGTDGNSIYWHGTEEAGDYNNGLTLIGIRLGINRKDAIRCNYTDDIHMDGVIITGAGAVQVRLSFCRYINISHLKSKLTTSSYKSAVMVQGCKNITVSQCHLSASGKGSRCLNIDDTETLIVTNNTIKNAEKGINIFGKSQNAIITGNIFTNCPVKIENSAANSYIEGNI